jgi:hypothetical protein
MHSAGLVLGSSFVCVLEIVHETPESNRCGCVTGAPKGQMSWAQLGTVQGVNGMYMLVKVTGPRK